MTRIHLWAAGVIGLAVIAADVDAAARACEAAEPTLRRVYPSAETLPENTLRFYFYFSAPMHRAKTRAALRLTTDAGAVVPGAFLETRYGLWSPDSRRLTVILDPARVKSGLGANRALGRALQPGRSYRLSFGAGAQSQAGCPLAAAPAHRFTAHAFDPSLRDPATWRIRPPAAASRAPLIVDFGEPIDHLSAAYGLRVRDAAGAPLRGAIDLQEHESRWLFTPAEPWAAAPHLLVVAASLEDLAGNQPQRSFESDADAAPAAALSLPFSPAAPSD